MTHYSSNISGLTICLYGLLIGNPSSNHFSVIASEDNNTTLTELRCGILLGEFGDWDQNDRICRLIDNVLNFRNSH